MTKHNVENTSDRELVITRLFNAPRELVWTAWTDPKHLVNWWGPRGFTNTFQEIDIKPGGVWRFIMHGPDGRDYPNHIVFDEVVKPERITYSHGEEAGKPVHFHVTVTFAEQNGKTNLTMRSIFPTAAARDHVVKKYGAIEGGNQTMDRLAETLEKLGAPKGDFVISREFAAPRELVWKAWTERDRLMQWFGPKGFTMPISKMDFRPGGTFLYCLRSAAGQEMWGKFVYREIVAPERIVWVHSFSDENGGVTRHPMSPTWPAEMLSRATFTESAGKTTVTLRWSAMNASETEQQTFDSNHDGMKMGWTGTFEQFDAYLAKVQSDSAKK